MKSTEREKFRLLGCAVKSCKSLGDVIMSPVQLRTASLSSLLSECASHALIRVWTSPGVAGMAPMASGLGVAGTTW
eukprot:881680-Amphidinium_carterae.1